MAFQDFPSRPGLQCAGQMRGPLRKKELRTVYCQTPHNTSRLRAPGSPRKYANPAKPQ